MRRLLFLTLCLLAFSLPAKPQGGIINDSIIKTDGTPAVGSTVRVCTEAAGGLPCSPLASIFTDKALTIAKANPFATDATATYAYYAAPGFYKENICLSSTCVVRIIQINLDGSRVYSPFVPANNGDDLGTLSKRWDGLFVRIGVGSGSTLDPTTQVFVDETYTNPVNETGGVRANMRRIQTSSTVQDMAILS